MIDFIRIGVRTAAVVAIIAIAVGVYALFNSVQIPSAETTLIIQGVGMGKAILQHWAPELMWIITALIALFICKWSIMFLRLTVLGIKWLLTIWG